MVTREQISVRNSKEVEGNAIRSSTANVLIRGLLWCAATHRWAVFSDLLGGIESLDFPMNAAEEYTFGILFAKYALLNSCVYAKSASRHSRPVVCGFPLRRCW